MNALSILSKFLKIRKGDCFFSGTKDKRGDTVQKVIAKGLNEKLIADRLLNNKKWNFSNIFVSNLKTVENSTSLGDLYGNRFTLALRLVESTPEEKLE